MALACELVASRGLTRIRQQSAAIFAYHNRPFFQSTYNANLTLANEIAGHARNDKTSIYQRSEIHGCCDCAQHDRLKGCHSARSRGIHFIALKK